MSVQEGAVDRREAGRDEDAISIWDTRIHEERAFTEYLNILFGRKWLILSTMFAGAIVAVLVTLGMPQLYRATATIQIDREAVRIVEQRGAEPPANVGLQEFYQTQYGLLKSRALAEAVVRKLRLSENQALLFGPRGGPDDEKAAALMGNRKTREAMAIGAVRGGLVISPVRGSGLVEVSFSSADPNLSAQVANAVAENFIASNLARRYDATAYARRFLENELAAARRRLEASERNLVEYANSQRLITLDQTSETGATSSQSLASVDLATLNTALAQARADRIAAESKARGGSAAMQRQLDDPALGSLRQSRAERAAELAKLLTQFQPDYPPARALQQQIDEIDRQMANIRRAVGDSVQADYRAAVQREAQLQARVDALKQDVLNVRDRSIRYGILQREADTNREQYQALLQRFKEVSVAGGVGVNNVSIVDTALPPGAPYTPRRTLNVGIGILLGFLVGVGIAFLLAQLDQTVRFPHELGSRIGLPLLGSVPKLPRNVDVQAELADRQSTLVEAYNSIQTSLRFTTSHGAPRTILVTSARAAEGKTTTSFAIARNFAKLGLRTLLVDGDMRNPAVHRALSIVNTQGLSNALSGANPVDSIRVIDDHLSVMTSGPLPPNPAELLAGDQMAKLVAELGEKFDHIVIDGPPVLGLADAPLLSSCVEGAVFIVSARYTPAKAIQIALQRIARARGHLLGGVLTKFDQKDSAYGYGYTYSYKYGSADRWNSEDRELGS
jgi:capsular exopolysaccharide synthesis family protein